MLLDIQDPTLNPIVTGLFYGMALTALLSLVPWPLSGGRNRWTLWLPSLGLALYVTYEMVMPTRMNIRVDLALVWPMIAVIFLTWLARLFRIWQLNRPAAEPGRQADQ